MTFTKGVGAFAGATAGGALPSGGSALGVASALQGRQVTAPTNADPSLLQRIFGHVTYLPTTLTRLACDGIEALTIANKVMKPIALSELNLTRRLKADEVLVVKNGWDDDESKLQQFVKTLNSPEIVTLLKEDQKAQNIPAKAVQARTLGLLSDAQVASLCLVYQAFDQFIIDPKTLISSIERGEDGVQRNIVSGQRSFAKQSGYIVYMLGNDNSEHKRILKTFFSLTDFGYSKFIESLRNAPFLERVFYTFNVPLGSPISWSPMYDQIRGACGYFGLVDVEPVLQYGSCKQQMLVVPSFSMLQAFLHAIYPDSAVTLIPMLGKCSTRTIEKNVLEGKRILNIGMKGAEVRIVTDEHYAGPLVSSLHDLYHAERYSRIKRNEQLALIKVNKIFGKALANSPENKDLNHLKWRLIDGELHNSVVIKERFGTLFGLKNLPWKPPFIELVISDMVHEKKEWREEFQLSRDDLLEPEQKLYDQIEVKKYREEAELGKATAQNDLGVAYKYGRVVEQSHQLALRWFRKAAEQGLPLALFNLGVVYRNGEGVQKSDEEAVIWFRRAAELGFATAQFHLGCAYEDGEGVLQSDVDAAIWYQKAATQENAAALFNLGLFYTHGRGGLKADAEEAARLYLLAANQQYRAAQNSLGVAYKTGQGVKRSDEEAVKWYRKAADLGHATAQYNLAVAYEKGEGIEQSVAEAKKWYQKAADQGLPQAQLAIKEITEARS